METIIEINKYYSIYKIKILLYSLVYIIKKDYSFKINNIINII